MSRPELRARLSEVTFELASISRQGPRARRQLAKVREELEDERARLRKELAPAQHRCGKKSTRRRPCGS